MEKIKIRISSLIDGVPWLFNGEGTKTVIDNRIILDATEYIEENKVIHHIDFTDERISITRLAEGRTSLEFNKSRRGHVSIQTEMGVFTGKIITKTFAIKKTDNSVYLSLAYNTDFDSADASVKKVQISYSAI